MNCTVSRVEGEEGENVKSATGGFLSPIPTTWLAVAVAPLSSVTRRVTLWKPAVGNRYSVTGSVVKRS